MSQRVRHAERPRLNSNKLDKPIMIRPLARLRGSALRGRSLGRAIVILALSTTYSVAAAKEINTATIKEQQPVYDLMNIKLYLHNKLNDWDQFECANQLGIRESNWRVDAVNMRSNAYGIFQHMSDYAHNWDAYEQIDKHIIYINARYDGSWCKALDHLENKGWH